MPLKPTFHRVLVRPVTREKSRGGLFIPDTAEEKNQPVVGEVVAVGDGRRPSGAVVPIDLKPGDRVIFRKHAGRRATLDVGARQADGSLAGEEDLLFIADEDIEAVVEGDVEVIGWAGRR